MADTPPTLDGISQPAQQAVNPVPVEEVTDDEKKRMKRLLLMFLGVPYGVYVVWSLFLMSVLPNPQGNFEFLIPIAMLLAAGVAIALLLFAALMAKHILGAKDIPMQNRYISLSKVVGVIVPGLILSGIIPLSVTAEPALQIMITSPVGSEIVAPTAVTFNLEQAVDVLRRRNLNPVSFVWDFNGDGNREEETVVPTATAVYERPGGYNVQAIITLSDGSKRLTNYRLIISRAVFSMSPLQPVIDQPVRFSVGHLLDDPLLLKEVRWDFNGDGETDVTDSKPDAVYTYRQTGNATVTAVILLTSQVQQTFSKTITIQDPEVLSFPVKMVTEPPNLISPPPFGIIFRIESEEPLRSVLWDFGDGEKGEGERVGHTYRDKGTYPITAEVRTTSGSFAKLSALVRVVDPLVLTDLQIDGTPTIDPRESKMVAGLPASIELTPRTNVPLIEFDWEVPGATVVGSTEGTLQAIYRRAGTYPVSLIARDTEGRALRRNYTLQVNPVTSIVSIRMTPEGGVAPLLVRFDASETVIPGEEITGFEWYFGDEEITAPKQGGAQVEYLFQEPGTFNVLLKAYTTSGKTFEETRTIVIRAPVLDACFFPSRTTGEAPLGVKFDMKCTSGTPSEIEWDFGDGSQSDERNPIHVFEDIGVYQVTLTVRDTTGGVSKELVTITVK